MTLSIKRKTVRRPKLKLTPELNGIVMTPQEFDDAESFVKGYRYELLRGILVVSPPPAAEDRDSNGELEYLLRFYQKSHPQGGSVDLTLSEQEIVIGNDRRRADRAIWVGLGRSPDVRVDVPAIVIEIVSQAKSDALRDYETKRTEYLGIPAIQEYWIIDRFVRAMTVVRRTSIGVEEVVVPDGGLYQTPRLPGFELNLGDLFHRADTLVEAGTPKGKPPKRQA